MNAVSGENLSGVFLPMKSTWVSRTTPAAQGAARCTAAKSLTRKDIDQSI
jgi:hypothetical protein